MMIGRTILLKTKSLNFILVALLIAGCAKNPVTGKRELNFMSEQQEIALGQQSDPEIVAAYGLYEDLDLQSFIDEKGQEMARISHRRHLNFEFKILDSPVVNAFAVPGGYVYFTRGIMAHFNNEAEFAGVLGHEIGHVTARHSARQYTNQMLGQLLLVGGMVLSPEFRQFGDVASESLGLLFMSFSREHESESDELGVAYSTIIGYDSHQMGDFFSTLHRLSTKDGQQSIPSFQSTHPDPLDRYQDVHNLSEVAQSQHPNREYAIGRDSYLAMIDGLIYGEDPRQGYVEGGWFYHPELKFHYKLPAGWQTINSPTQVQMAEPDGKAVMYLSLGQGSSLDEALNNEMQQNQLSLISKSKTTVNGLPALVATSEQVGQDNRGQQIKIQALSYFIQYNGLIYKMNGITYAQSFNQFKSVFESSMKSFAILKDAGKINRKPDRIRIETVSSKKSLKQALSGFNMPSSRHEELAILNGMELTDLLESGTKIKTIVN